MSRPVDARLNRSGLGQLSETDQIPVPGADQIGERDPARTAVPPEQRRPHETDHEHTDLDTPGHVHPVYAMSGAGAEASSTADEREEGR